MVVEQNKVVAVTYELRVNDKNGEIIEKVENESPLTFIFGRGNLLPDFESNINGLKKGDAFNFKLDPEKAYGHVSDEAVAELPKNLFEIDGKIDENILKVGNNIPMQDNSGNRLNGIVTEIGDEVVKMDFNHPLAGDTLYFSGTVSFVRDATQEELDHGHIHKAGSHPCGGGGECGSGHGDGCC